MNNYGWNPFSKDIQWEDRIEEKEQGLIEVIDRLLEVSDGDILKAAVYAYMLGYSLEVAGSIGMVYQGGGIFGEEEISDN